MGEPVMPVAGMEVLDQFGRKDDDHCRMPDDLYQVGHIGIECIDTYFFSW